MASFTNMATLSYNGSQINSNVVTGELRDALTITKTAVSGGYRPGDTVTYVVTLSNTGTAALTGLTLTDDLGGSTVAAGTVYPLAYVPGSVLYYNGGTAQPAPTVTAGPPMTVTGVTVPAGGNATLVYQARVTEFAAPGVEGEIRNTVTASGGGLATPLTATAATAVIGCAVPGAALAEDAEAPSRGSEIKRVRTCCRGCGKMECGVWVTVENGRAVKVDA